MKKGRLTIEEHNRRLKLLLEFIFIFRYATRKQIYGFIQGVMKILSSQWLIEHTVRQGYLKAYNNLVLNAKIYYLTGKGKKAIYDDESLIGHYRFEKSHVGINAFIRQNMLVEAYFCLNCHLNLELKNWLCEWCLRIGRRRREKVPDGLFTSRDGKQIALEIETRPKNLSALKRMVDSYRYNIDKVSRYHGVLVVTDSRNYYEGLKVRLFHIASEFCGRAFLLADMEMLREGRCFYKENLCRIEEAIRLLERKSYETAS